MKALICECCGGQINPRTYKCEYCGTAYKRDADDNIIRIETFHNPVKEYTSSMEIPPEVSLCLGKDVGRYAVEQLANHLTEAIAECMELVYTYDPMRMSHRITARVRMVEPVNTYREVRWWK